jgi:DNA-binding response OmpR family regulator
LIILDVMLPGRDGIEVLQTLRRQGTKGRSCC